MTEVDAESSDVKREGGRSALSDNASYQIFMLLLSIYALLAMVVETCFKLDADTSDILIYADTVVCGLFFIDFLYCLITAERKLDYIKWGWLDLISSIPLIGPLRFSRATRIFRIVRVLRGMKSARNIVKFVLQKRAESAFFATAFVAIILVIFASISILNFEKMENATIHDAETALWWAFTTITTVGYGDAYPLSTEGRILAGVLMIAGVGLFGTFTASVASWFVSTKKDESDKELAQMKEELSEAIRRLEALAGDRRIGE